MPQCRSLSVLDDEVGYLILVRHGQLVVGQELGRPCVGVLREVVGELQGRLAVLDIDIKNVVVLLSQILDLAAAAGCRIDDGPNTNPLLLA